MKVLLLASGFNGLCQRVHRELTLLGHTVSVELSISPNKMIEAVRLFSPDIVICPFLKERIPESIWKEYRCLIVHPGIEGDRGPSSLDWAIANNLSKWGVTILQADKEMDAGDIWATQNFSLRSGSKASIYRREVTQTAIRLIKQTVNNLKNKKFRPRPLNYKNPKVKGCLQPLMKQEVRQIDWQNDNTDAILRKINAADSFPGVLDKILGEDAYIYKVKKEHSLNGKAGHIIGRCEDRICKATIDGAVWISVAKLKNGKQNKCIKLPASQALETVMNMRGEYSRIPIVDSKTDKDIYWKIENDVAYLYFDFYNGAMNTEQCMRLRLALHALKRQSAKVIVLMGGEDFWSNGIHLNCIEANDNPGKESWENLQAIDDVVEEIILSPKHITIAALRNNAGAGGAIMPLACDQVILREGVVLNPHYATMGLYGSEYWTYLLPKRVGPKKAQTIMQECLPLLAAEAHFLGIGDEIFGEDWLQYHESIKHHAELLTQSKVLKAMLKEKRKQRQKDEKIKRLHQYRKEELSKMHQSFFDPGSDYHQARQNFVYKKPATKTPERIALHRQPTELKMVAN